MTHTELKADNDRMRRSIQRMTTRNLDLEDENVRLWNAIRDWKELARRAKSKDWHKKQVLAELLKKVESFE